MLRSLYVKDYVLIDEIKIDFGAGLNIITGETGAGKSIIVGAISAILGEPLNKESIRTGALKAIFEAHFDIKGAQIKNVLQQNDLDDYDTQLIIRRELNASGRGRCFINDSPVSLALLAEIGDLLVDLHGQHEHQLLLKSSRHIDYLDAFADNSALLKQIKQSHNTLKDIQNRLATLRDRQQQANQARDLLKFQLNEISAVDPQDGEEEALLREEKILRNAELLFEKAKALGDRLYERDGAVAEELRTAEKVLAELAAIDQDFETSRRECESARIIVEDISILLQKYAGSISFDAEKLERIRQRLSLLNGLKKKYGGSMESVLNHKQAVESEIGLLENLQESIADLHAQLERERDVLADLCQRASAIRQKSGIDLAEKVTAELAHLGMAKAEFRIANEIRETEQELYVRIDGKNVAATAKGIDHVEFIIRSNPGEDFKAMVNIASGGEISRIMLALKTLLVEADNVPVLIFDEIDAGISGRIAQAVGVSLKRLAASHQIISITHLPQIASMANDHYLVEKVADEQRTQVRIKKLTASERQEQIAQLVGGEKVTEAHLKSAADLIQQAAQLSKEKS
ncbi:DNA repair protein RecN [candidate division KSB1 bacterium]|nr:DNA repair protein RecN [candidate division KSB1 bacterium]RQW02318.1 MAG: DNA repair protein RecN [candidate division KSB1 bacterium]